MVFMAAQFKLQYGPMNSRALEFKTHSSISDIPVDQWNHLTDPNNPFLDHEFLTALEQSGCIGGDSGWVFRFIAAWDTHELIGALPVFEKHHTYGEFLYDWEWQRAYSRAGLPYYPKAFLGSPYTPASGRKFLGEDLQVIAELIAQLKRVQAQYGWHSIHAAFVTWDEQHTLVAHGFIPRTHFQYYWHNHNYRTFDDFLDTLKSSRRKQIKKERRIVNELGLNIQVKSGNQLTPTDVHALFQFYMSTHDKKQGHPHLNAACFSRLVELMPDRILTVIAYQNEVPVAGTFNFIKGNKVYGRYWGCSIEFPNLHFECCYYQLVEVAIQRGWVTVEAGAMGDHKFFRGFNPEETYYAHTFSLPDGHRAVERHVSQEAAHIEETMAQLRVASAYKNSGVGGLPGSSI